MSKIYAYDDLRDNQWDVIEENTSSNYADLHIGFTNELPIVEFDNLSFGFELRKDGEVIDIQQYPPEGVIYRRTDQTYLITHRLKFAPETEYELFVWGENGGIRAEKTHIFTTPRPPQPYPSWIWDGSTWNPPIPYPTDGEYEWDEETQNWIEILDNIE